MERKRSGLLNGCRSVDCFEYLNSIDEGTFGIVYRARDKTTGQVVALKKIKSTQEKEGFPITSLREMSLLQQLSHPNIVKVSEVVVGSSLDKVYMVMEFMDHELKTLIESSKFTVAEAKCLMQQLLSAVAYLHENFVMHRDLKTSNLLLNNQGELKICDFGLARKYGDPLRPYTHLVVTLFYRAPELLLGQETYSSAIDMWSVGCIMAELILRTPLFPGANEMDQIEKIMSVLGTPRDEDWTEMQTLKHASLLRISKPLPSRIRDKFPQVSFIGDPTLSESGLDLLDSMLQYAPRKRISAAEALRHPWFEETPLPQHQSFLPYVPSLNTKRRTKA